MFFFKKTFFFKKNVFFQNVQNTPLWAWKCVKLTLYVAEECSHSHFSAHWAVIDDFYASKETFCSSTKPSKYSMRIWLPKINHISHHQSQSRGQCSKILWFWPVFCWNLAILTRFWVFLSHFGPLFFFKKNVFFQNVQNTPFALGNVWNWPCMLKRSVHIVTLVLIEQS